MDFKIRLEHPSVHNQNSYARENYLKCQMYTQ